jgi:hypothetical protein
MSQEPEVQQKKIAHAEAPQEQSASQLVSATLGASASEDATDNASTPLDASQQNSQARVAMPGQADTEPASRAGSIAAGSKIGQQAQVSAAGQPTPEADVAAAQLVSAAPAEPAAAKAKQANGGLAVQRQQASIDELTASAPAVGDKSAMAGSPADAQSRASSATAGASAAADAAPSGHGCQIRVNQIYAGFIAVFICRQYFAVA